MYDSGPAKEVFEKFISDLELFVDSKAINISLEDTWMKDNPTRHNKSIIEYIGSQHTMKTLKVFDLWKNTEKFRADYKGTFGKEPYVNPMIRDSWSDAKNVTKDDEKHALDRKDVFRQWFLRSILRHKEKKKITNTIGANTITVVPISDPEPEYRDVYRKGPWKGGSGFHRNFISVLTGCPEVVVPIGQIPYQSRVSKREEFLPVVIAILGAPGKNTFDIQGSQAHSPLPGTDAALIKFVADALRNARRPTFVMTGAEAFPK
jgi:hypothetical protein